VTANAEVLWMLAEHLALTAAPGIAGTLVAMRLGLRSVPLLLAVALAASGLVAILSFWAYYADPSIGRIWAYVVLFGSVEAAVWSAWRGGLDRRLLRQLSVPLLLWVFGSFFVVYLGFLHGGTDQAISMSATRFSWQLPSDNDIPQFFATWFYEHGHSDVPPVYPGEWLMSDRPPLQIGYVLSERTFAWDAANLHYQVLCAAIQQLWIVAMWAVLCAARVAARTRALVMFAAMVSDLAIVHGFFVWPKLLAAAFLLGAVALVISPEWPRWRRDPRVAGLFACLCALAMLAHGASLFGIVPLLALAALRGLPDWRWLGAAAMVGILLLAPWSAYQRFEDPPGNRLLKWQLGNALAVDDRGTAEAIVDGYEEAGLEDSLVNKRENLGTIVGLPLVPREVKNGTEHLANGEFKEAITSFRVPRFFSLLPFLGLFLIGPIAMLVAWARGRRERGAEWRFAVFSFAFAAIGCAVWALLLFGTPDARTTLHVGSFALPLLALCGCVAGLHALHPRLAVGAVALNALLVLAAYVPSLTPVPGSSYSPIAAVLAGLGLAGFGVIAAKSAKHDLA
jgi:hypothetical protein